MTQALGQLDFYDSSHEYRLGGQRLVNITSASKIPVNNYALEAWDRRITAEALIKNPEMFERVAAALGNNDAMDRALDDGKRAVGAYDKAERGKLMHLVLQWVLLGRTDLLLTARQRADAEALQRTLDRYQLTPTRFVESIVLYRKSMVAGRLDAILERSDGTLILVDLKSAANAIKYPQSVSVQLALYGNAPHVAASVQTTGDRTVVAKWTTLSENLDRDRGYVLLVQPGEPIGSLHEIDIRHRWVGAQLALRIVQWRREFNYGKGLAREVQPAADFPAKSGKA